MEANKTVLPALKVFDTGCGVAIGTEEHHLFFSNNAAKSRFAVASGLTHQQEVAAYAAFIVRACNSHQPLVDALQDVISWVPGQAAWHTDAPLKAVERARALLDSLRAA